METLLWATIQLLLLSSSAMSQRGADYDLEISGDSVLRIKTFQGVPQSSYEEIPLSAIEGWTGTTPTKEKCTMEKSSIVTLHVNNSTMGYLTSSLSTKLIPAIYIVVFLVGVSANAATLWMLYFQTKSITMNIFYINLAVADLLFCVTLPFKVAYHLHGNNWLFGEVMCRVITAVFYGNMYCSSLLLTCISVSRYLAIVYPFTYRGLPKRMYAMLACGLVWVTLFLYMVPLFITKQVYYLDQLGIYTCHDVHNTCEMMSHFHLYYFISLAFIGFVIPLGVIIFCYTSIIRTLKAYDQKWFWYFKVSLLILVIFAICFAPSNIILIIHHVNYNNNKNTDDLYFFYLIALCLGSLNSCLDPFLYFLMSKITDRSNAYLTIIKTS
ncbi:proteinase-activated receptor 3 [Monodelphis domestica]|uniref:proteinase-activated receptor 3 n=1 Tax=Monodelphis domestica TaxID=13616 RepID=UPI0024E2502D|nr:proteinase-activated receptor 3 [Monodelphis domestica]